MNNIKLVMYLGSLKKIIPSMHITNGMPVITVSSHDHPLTGDEHPTWKAISATGTVSNAMAFTADNTHAGVMFASFTLTFHRDICQGRCSFKLCHFSCRAISACPAVLLVLRLRCPVLTFDLQNLLRGRKTTSWPSFQLHFWLDAECGVKRDAFDAALKSEVPQLH